MAEKFSKDRIKKPISIEEKYISNLDDIIALIWACTNIIY